MLTNNLQINIQNILSALGGEKKVDVKPFYIGQKTFIDAVIIYIEPLVNKELIDRDILKPLMSAVDENIIPKSDVSNFIAKKYIYVCTTSIESDLNNIVDEIKKGNTAILIDNSTDCIVATTIGGEYRSISEPDNESVIQGVREGFVENLKFNIAMILRTLKDSNLTMQYTTVGKRSQTQLAIMYIDDIVDKRLLNDLMSKLNNIDVDFINDAGMLSQHLESRPYSIFPQIKTTERPDVVKANLLEGRIAILLQGAPCAILLPCTLIEFFQSPEDYYHRTIVSSFTRILRFVSTFIVMTVPSIYLSLILYNIELIPVKFIGPIIESRKGIALSPFLEIFAMEIVVEILREGGSRLPPRIGQTLSIVGGIIIGNTAVDSKIVSPTTLLIVGISTISTFLIPNYEMSLSIRLLRFPMLIIANVLGFFGISAFIFFLIAYICHMENFSVQYVSIESEDLKDSFIRAPLTQMEKRSESIPNNNTIKQLLKNKPFGRKK